MLLAFLNSKVTKKQKNIFKKHVGPLYIGPEFCHTKKKCSDKIKLDVVLNHLC